MLAVGDRLAFVATHTLLRQLLAERLDCRPGEIVFRRERCPICGGPNGRPALERPFHSAEFSISRTEGLALVGIASVPVGVDVQTIPEHELARDVGALLHPAEQSELFATDAEDQPAVFARLWTRKEAYLKGIGSGIAHELAADNLGADKPAMAPRGWTLLDLSLGARYAAAAAVRCSVTAA